MKKILLVLGLVFTITLLVPTPAFAFTGVSGTVVDGNNDPWLHGGTVYAYSCDFSSTYIADGDFSGSSFDIGWDASGPTPGTCVVLYILYTDPPGPWPPPAYYETSFNQTPIPGSNPLGVISIGNFGPNAIELLDFSVNSQSTSSPWLPFALLVVSVILVSGAITYIRKRRA